MGTALETVRRAQSGDEEAFAALFQENRKRVYLHCLRLTQDASRAEDLTQDTFLQVFRTLGQFRGDAAFSTWLYRVAANMVFISHRRQKSRPQEVSYDAPLTGREDGLALDVGAEDSALSGADDRVDMRRAFDSLPPGSAEVYRLHEVQGYQHHEIATLLGVSIGTSKSQLNRAKAKMKKRLKP
jgi:RNA polymerase sigma-70 factor, ECF subfamily